eukprot:TRINITY_DN1894_c0_g1_i1.p1 TRINITY_DN1894_c0_g1~~TRINITY_DN1894_c0_g1_i1.p1  ORF type:complete len:213 (-),score=78.93 TRINITY_DN1894_c0_g1_i1:307-945(-)
METVLDGKEKEMEDKVSELNDKVTGLIGKLELKEEVIVKLKQQLRQTETSLALHQLEVSSLEKSLSESLEALKKSEQFTKVLGALEKDLQKKDDVIRELARRVKELDREKTSLEFQQEELVKAMEKRRRKELSNMERKYIQQLNRVKSISVERETELEKMLKAAEEQLGGMDSSSRKSSSSVENGSRRGSSSNNHHVSRKSRAAATTLTPIQ